MIPLAPAFLTLGGPLFVVIVLLLLAVPGHLAMADSAAAETASRDNQADTVGNADNDGGDVQDKRDRCRSQLPGGKDINEIGCPTAVDPFVELKFDDETHRGWYIRFWTGACDRIPIDSERTRCWFAKIRYPEYWFETVDIVVGKVPATERPVIQFDLWGLGRLIGHEWARANAVRLIKNPDLVKWEKRLLNAAPENVSKEIRELFAAARAKLEGS